MNTSFLLSGYALISALCWLWVGVAAIIAIFSVYVKDTLLERIGLGWVSFGSIAAAWQIFQLGFVSETLLFVSCGFAFYVTVVFVKCWRCYHSLILNCPHPSAHSCPARKIHVC